MKLRRRCFVLFFVYFLGHPFANHAQVISATTDSVELDGIRLPEMVDYIKARSFSMEDYLGKKGFNKIQNNKESYFVNESAKSRVFLSLKENNQLLPKSIAGLKQDYIAIRSENSSFKATVEKIIEELKTDENFSVDTDTGKGEISFYSIKKDFYIKIFSSAGYELIAVY